MKKLLFFLLAFPALAYSEGPLFQHEATSVQQEYENVYQDIRSIRSVLGSTLTVRAIIFTGDSSTQTVSSKSQGVWIASTTAATSFTGTIAEDDSTPLITEGGEVLSSTFTSKSPTSLLQVVFNTLVSNTAAGTMACSLFRTGTSAALATSGTRQSAGVGHNVSLVATIDSQAGAQNLTIRCGNSGAGTTQINSGNASGREYGGAAVTIMVITEIPKPTN
jgi:hypothetical protein